MNGNKLKLNKMKLYTRPGCPACDAIVIPEGINLEKINVLSKDYNGYVPNELPVLQIAPGFDANGEYFVNQALELVKKAQDGVFRK